MAEDVSILSEIDEALRADKLQSFWARYGSTFITFCVLAVIATAASSWWKGHLREQHEQETGLLSQGVALAQAGKNGEAIGIFEKVEEKGGPLAGLARLRHAQALVAMKQDAKALTFYNDMAAGKNDSPQALRDYARLEAGIIADNQPTGAAPAVNKPTDGVFSQSMMETQALAAMKAGDTKTAGTLLAGIVADPMASLNARTRAAEMLATIKEDKK